MYNNCCVVNCDSRRKVVNFYRFPKSEIGLKKWLQCINCERLNNLSFTDLQKHFVCKKHFEKRFFAETHARSRLRIGAYPTLFTHSEISNGFPEQNAYFNDHHTKNNNCYQKRKHEDHSYYKFEEKGHKIEIELDNMPSETLLLQNIENLPDVSYDLHSTSDCEINPTEKPMARVISPKLSTYKKHVTLNKNSIPPRCAILHMQYIKSKKQQKIRKLTKKPRKFSKEKAFERLTKNVNPLAKKILWMQIKQSKKLSRGRRFTKEEKFIALSIMKESPSCYKFLHKIFILPSENTLNKMIARLNIDAGISPQTV